MADASQEQYTSVGIMFFSCSQSRLLVIMLTVTLRFDAAHRAFLKCGRTGEEEGKVKTMRGKREKCKNC